MLSFFLTQVKAQQVKLGWTPSEDENVVAYGIYRSSHPDSAFSLLSTVSDPESTYIDNTTVWDVHYFYAATSQTGVGNESGFSNVVDTLLTDPMPVELEVFEGHLNAGSIILRWVTATESNNYGFEIHRKVNNAQNFTKIAFVKGNGTITSPNRYHYTDKNVGIGKYYYRLKQIDFGGEFTYSGTIEITAGIPNEFRLNQNYPNPFNPETRISYTLPKSTNVVLKIFDINGKQVKTLVEEYQRVGNHATIWDGTDENGFSVSSGVYYYKIKTEYGSQFRRMMFLK